jgi:phosphate-selective porin OprO/OprP
MSIEPRRSTPRALIACLAFCTLASGVARGQAPPPDPTPTPTAAPPAVKPPTSLDDTIEAGDSDAETPSRVFLRWNHYEGPWFTIEAHGGLLYEGIGYSQDDESEQQFTLDSEGKFRDARFMLKGRFPASERGITYTSAYMYDGPTDEWFIRETGVMVPVPELWGNIFVGRSKEGFSLNKVMSGYAGWTMERATFTDATIPILADGIKWLGYVPDKKILWNVGFYNDWLSEGQSFSTYDKQAVARLAWLPIADEASRTLLHLGLNFRYGETEDGVLRLRSRPEAFPAPYFIDTGTFEADHTRMFGFEGYYRPGNWLFGTEYYVQEADSPAHGDPRFHGGDAVVAWLITGETRIYNVKGGYFNQVSPTTPVGEGGSGAWEAVLRFSFSDLDDGDLRGGKFWRITPMVNWHLSDQARFELAYGYGMLDRFSVEGATHFLQSRIQLQF